MSITYADKPVFGLDIGRSSIKVMEIDPISKKPTVRAYGSSLFDVSAIDKGVITHPEIIVKQIYELVTKNLIGQLSTRHVALSLPNEHSFSRVLLLPKLDEKNLDTAVQSEIEQSIPLPLAQLYFDYEVTSRHDDMVEVQVVATPRSIVDSYLVVAAALGLEVAAIETNIMSVTRMVIQTEITDIVTLIVDMGSTAADLSVYDGTLRITGTADCASENMTDHISQALSISRDQAYTIKTRYGIEATKKQADILGAVEPELTKLTTEVKKMMRYYEERSAGNKAVEQIILLGGGANLPGLSTYMTDHLRVPTRLYDPWLHLTFGHLQPPHQAQTTLFATAGGLSLIKPGDLLK